MFRARCWNEAVEEIEQIAIHVVYAFAGERIGFEALPAEAPAPTYQYSPKSSEM